MRNSISTRYEENNLHSRARAEKRRELIQWVVVGNLRSLWQQDRVCTKLHCVVPVVMRSLQQVAVRFREQVFEYR